VAALRSATGRGEVVLAEDLVGLEFIYLARLGLRSPDDRRILDSLTVAEAVLRSDTPCGPVYHRYNGDGYGEREDGRPYNGTGIGRGWPLLVGERGHLALLQGEDPLPFLDAMTCMTGPCGLLPEQVWDSGPIPRFGLTPGKPTGRVMPLVWAHAEFLKLLVAREHRRPVELLEAVSRRYAGKRPAADTWYWRSGSEFDALPVGRSLVVEDSQPIVLHFGVDGWKEVQDRTSEPLGLGMHGVRLDRGELTTCARLNFMRVYPAGNLWEGADHQVELMSTSLASVPVEPASKARA
jgi:glucoamylase